MRSVVVPVGSADAGLIISPNPASGAVSVSISRGDIRQLSIYDAAGKEVTSQCFIACNSDYQCLVGLAQLPKGTYWLKCGAGARALIVR